MQIGRLCKLNDFDDLFEKCRISNRERGRFHQLRLAVVFTTIYYNTITIIKVMMRHGCIVFITVLQFLGTTFANFPFETCVDYGSTYTGNCTVLTHDGAIGAESVSNVWIQNGYLDYGPYWYGCPYKNNTCPSPTGFSFYGWIKFHEYPSNCSDYGVVVSTEVFNIHLLGNGHLAVYAWLPNGTEYYAETFQPVMLDVFYPTIVQFEFVPSTNTWTLSVVLQSQLSAGALYGRRRTYIPPNNNLLFGGNGDRKQPHSASVQLDRISLDSSTRDFPYIYQVMMDFSARQYYCNVKYGVLTEPLTCYWVERWSPKTWTEAYKFCKQTAYDYGYPVGRLAWFPSWNETVWNSVINRLAYYGNNSYSGYKAWIGGGKSLHWLHESMKETGIMAVVPQDVISSTSGSTDSSCLQLNTQVSPWEWSESNCINVQPFICQMTFTCLPINPCKNLGVCLPYNDGETICKCLPGTSGRFCEEGFPSSTCINNCSCPNPFVNCSMCLNDTINLVKGYKTLKEQIKLKLAELDIDFDIFEKWECFVSNEMKKFPNIFGELKQLTISNTMAACEKLGKLIAKLSVQSVVIKRYLKHLLDNLSSQTDPNVINLCKTVNETQFNFTKLPCVTSLVQNFTNTTYFANSGYVQVADDFLSKVEDYLNNLLFNITLDTTTKPSLTIF